MEQYILNLNAPFKQTKVDIIHKNIKNIHLKVYRDFKVVLSVPLTTNDEWIESFLNTKSNWIEKQLLKYKNSSGYNSLLNVKSGTSTQFLGKDCIIVRKRSDKNYVVMDEKNIVLNLIDVDDEITHKYLLEKWWRKNAYEIYEYEMINIYNKIFKKYKIDKPKLYIRKMKTMWGSCTPSKNKITLNEYLLKADLRCIQYVILHELTHLIYPYHNKDFYSFITIHMPDWKDVKKHLDEVVVQWL